MRDSGCFQKGPELLDSFRGSHRHGLLVLDAAWDGAPSAMKMERELATRVQRTWGADAAVLVLNPELETWAFTGSDKLADHLGWSLMRHGDFKFWLAQRVGESGKPSDPKGVLDQATKLTHRPRNPAWWGKLGAMPINFNACADPAFVKLKQSLQRWFALRA